MGKPLPGPQKLPAEIKDIKDVARVVFALYASLDSPRQEIERNVP